MWNSLRMLWVIKDWWKYNNPPFTNCFNSHVISKVCLEWQKIWKNHGIFITWMCKNAFLAQTMGITSEVKILIWRYRTFNNSQWNKYVVKYIMQCLNEYLSIRNNIFLWITIFWKILPTKKKKKNYMINWIYKFLYIFLLFTK